MTATAPFFAMLDARRESGRIITLGLDPDLSRLPVHLRPTLPRDTNPDGYKQQALHGIHTFCERILAAIGDKPLAIKPNFAFFGRYGWRGMEVLDAIIRTARHNGTLVIGDGKREDIGNSAEGYADEYAAYGCHAGTVNVYMGGDTIAPFTNRTNCGVYALCLTSNPGAKDLQMQEFRFRDPDAIANLSRSRARKFAGVAKGFSGENWLTLPQFLYVAHLAVTEWNKDNNVGLVVGATHTDELRQVCEIIRDTGVHLLLPGLKTQGGNPKDVIRVLRDTDLLGVATVNYSREVLYPKEGIDGADYAERALDRYLAAEAEMAALLDP